MTLLEVLLAVGIFATMMALTWGSVSSSFRLRKASGETFERYRHVQMALDRMTRELSMAFVTNIGEPPTNDRRESTYKTTFDGSDREVTFTSFAFVRHRADQPGTDQAAFTYRVERRRGLDGRYGSHLVRRAESPIDATPERGGEVYVLLEDVRQVRFEYFDGAEEATGDGWNRSWDALGERESRLPARVRITIEIDHPHRRNQTLTFVSQAQVHLTEPVKLVPARLLEELRAAEAAIPEEIREQFERARNQRDGVRQLQGVQTIPMQQPRARRLQR